MSEQDELDRDLAALRAVSARNVPDLSETIQTIRRRELGSPSGISKIRRFIMEQIHTVRTRPAIAAAVLGVVVVLVAMVVPVSYERVTGHEVTLTFAGKEVGSQEVHAVADGLKGLLDSKSVTVEALADEGSPRYVMRATSTKRAGKELQRAAGAFASDLASKGYAASVQVLPHRERVRNPAVAYAWDQIIRISVDGKSAADLESEIRNRLAEAGVPGAQVSVTDHPGGGRDVRLRVERQHTGDAGTAPPEPMPQLVLTKDGAPVQGGEGFAVKIQRKKINGATSLHVEVDSNGKTAKIEIQNSDTLSDAAIADAITTQLRQAGIEAQVTVTGGKVSIESTK